MNDMKWKNLRQGCFIRSFMLFWIAALLCIAASHGWAGGSEKQTLETVEIEGISINTPLEKIAGILQARDYTQLKESLYTKQEYADKGRSTISRVEIDESPAFRQITYYRGMSGGRIKSPTSRDAPIPESDLDMAQQLYRLVCTNVSEALKDERACDPLTLANVRFGHGQWVQIDEHFAAILIASDSNATIGVRFARD